MAMVVLREAGECLGTGVRTTACWTEGGLRRGVPLSCRRTCPDLAPCRFVGRLSWRHRAGPSATLDKSSSVVGGCYGHWATTSMPGPTELGHWSRVATVPQRASIAGNATAEADSCTLYGCASRAAGRSDRERLHWSRPDGHDSSPRDTSRSSDETFARTSRPPSCTRTPSATARASSPPRDRSSSGPASTPAARPRTSSSSMSRAAATRSGGARSTGRSPRRTTIALRARLIAYCADRDLYSQDCFIGAAAAHRRSLRVYTETAWASIFARNLFRRPTAGQLRSFAPNFTIIDVPSFQADPATEGTRIGDGDPRPPSADGDHHRRHRVRRRDQEERLHGHELPHARRRRPADALGDQRRPGRRPGRLLRAVGDGQDHALGRPAAQPHR